MGEQGSGAAVWHPVGGCRRPIRRGDWRAQLDPLRLLRMSAFHPLWRHLHLVGWLLLVSGCSSEDPPPDPTVVRVAVLPDESERSLRLRYRDLLTYLSDQLGVPVEFGTTGKLRNSDLVMYDRQTETWWQQATGEGIVGEYAGRKLRFISSPVVDWQTMKQQYPDAQVLSRDTGHRRNYGANPYVGYDSQESPIRSFFRAKKDNRLPSMERIVALEIGDDARAYPFSSLKEDPAVNDKVGDEDVVVLWTPGAASALDTRSIADGRDVGATGVFSRRLGSRVLTFEDADNGLFRDRETGDRTGEFLREHQPDRPAAVVFFIGQFGDGDAVCVCGVRAKKPFCGQGVTVLIREIAATCADIR